MTSPSRSPDFPMVIEIRAELGEELYSDHPGWDEVPGRRGVYRLPINAQEVLPLAKERNPDFVAALCDAIEAAYSRIAYNQRPWGM